MNIPAKPVPNITPLDRPYWEFAKRGELRFQKCDRCGHFRHPPSPVCPECMSFEFQWAKSSGRGKVLSWVVFHRAYFASFEADVPYSVALVELEEGPVMATNLRGIDNADIRSGMEVEVIFEDVSDEVALPQFRPRRGAGQADRP